MEKRLKKSFIKVTMSAITALLFFFLFSVNTLNIWYMWREANNILSLIEDSGEPRGPAPQNRDGQFPPPDIPDQDGSDFEQDSDTEPGVNPSETPDMSDSTGAPPFEIPDNGPENADMDGGYNGEAVDNGGKSRGVDGSSDSSGGDGGTRSSDGGESSSGSPDRLRLRKNIPPDNFRSRIGGRRYFTASQNPDKTFSINVEHDTVSDSSVLIPMVQDISASGKRAGIMGDYAYKTDSSPEGWSLWAVDISSQMHSTINAAVISLIIGFICWLISLGVVNIMVRRAIAPILENSERQKRFVTDAGHELKTPIAIIMANAEMVEMDCPGSRWAANIISQAERLTGLTAALLDLSRSDEESIWAEPEIFDAGAETEAIARRYTEVLSSRGCGLEIHCPEKSMVKAVRKDYLKIAEAYIDNAAKYTDNGGIMEVDLRLVKGRLVLKVENTYSAGLENPSRLFDRFYRADPSRSRNSGGYGIGLSAAAAAAERLGAELNASWKDGMACFEMNMKSGKLI